MHLHDYDTSIRHQALLVSTDRVSAPGLLDEVRELVFDVHSDLSAEVGQSLGVLVPGDVDFGPKEHLRLYSISDVPESRDAGLTRFKICVKRVNYIDAYSGERYEGRASNYLCDLKVGDSVEMSGPFGLPYELPMDDEANLILIAMGTGIAPFRAFVKKLYKERPGFKGEVRLFHGARSGLEMLYMNEEQDDFAQYYDKETFEAFKALSPRPHWEDPIAWDHALGERGAELWRMMGEAHTRVYIAGQGSLEGTIDKVFSTIVGDPEKWSLRKAELKAGRRWTELYY